MTTAAQKTEALAVTQKGGDMLADENLFNQMWRGAKLFSCTTMVPKHFQGKPEDCFVAINVARRLNEDPLVVMQNFFLVSGSPGWKTEYVIARANRSGVFDGPIRWEVKGSGKSLEVTAFAEINGQRVDATVSMAMAEADGWTKNPKYKSMPEHMLRYRSAAFLVRLYAPEVMLGYQTAEELETTHQTQRVINVSRQEPAEAAPKKSALDALADAVEEVEPVEVEPEADSPAEPERPVVRLTKMAIKEIRAAAKEAGVSVDELEGILGEKLEDAGFPDARDPADAESTVLQIVRDLSEVE